MKRASLKLCIKIKNVTLFELRFSWSRLGRGVFTIGEDTHTLRLKSELFDLRVGYANPILRLGESQRGVRILSYRSQRNKKTTELFGLGCPFIWRRKRDSNPRGFWPNGFQDRLVVTASIFLHIIMHAVAL